MTEKELAQIETKLKIKLPDQYRQLIRARFPELQSLASVDDEFYGFFLDAEEVISCNKMERPADSGTGYAFPRWWKTFFLIGTNGGGDYYCLRLDNQPGVWMIGSDCGDEPTLIAPELNEYVDKRIEECEEELELQEERAQRRLEVAKFADIEAEPTEEEPPFVPVIPGKGFTWDFTWPHPTIDEKEFKKRLRAFGTDGGGALDDRAVLAFADWLETRGDGLSARHVRARCGLDDKAPGEDYPTFVEQFIETEFNFKKRGYPDFPGFSLGSRGIYPEQWNWSDGLDRGLASFVRIDDPRNDETCSGDSAQDVGRLIRRIEMLVRTTPVRGVAFQWHYPFGITAILDSPGGRQLRRISFASRPGPGQPCMVIDALARSPAVKTLERLDIHEGIQSDADALALAAAPFERLRRFELHAAVPIMCSARAVEKLTAAPWFRRLHHLLIGFSEDCCETGLSGLANMPELHTLGIWVPPERLITAIARAGRFPALRRLFIHCADLTGKYGAALARLQAPQLLELWFRNSMLKTADLRCLTTSPLFDKLRVLTFDGTRIDKKGLELVANHAWIIPNAHARFQAANE